MSDDRNGSIGWFLAGLGIGALVGILYAPKSGRETRESLMDSVDEGREYAAKRARQAREQVNDWVDKGKDAVSRQKDQIASAIDSGRQAYREALDKK
ncbi:MAG: YtxH domain-containing protein [Acidobacteriaceae bacterium]|nr:YtxH domain-containing protein [Acidobacteriaceae bacterium]